MAAPCDCWCTIYTSIRVRSSSMAWSLWSATAPVSESSSAIIITRTPGKRSGTGNREAAKKICGTTHACVVPQIFLAASLLLQGALAVALAIIREQDALALVDGL